MQENYIYEENDKSSLLWHLIIYKSKHQLSGKWEPPGDLELWTFDFHMNWLFL